MTAALGGRIQIVGDDLLVANTKYNRLLEIERELGPRPASGAERTAKRRFVPGAIRHRHRCSPCAGMEPTARDSLPSGASWRRVWSSPSDRSSALH